MRTKLAHSGNRIIITREDGVRVTLWYIGRCWVLRNSQADSTVEIAGSVTSEDRVVRAVRKWLREDNLPIVDVHCTGW
jgi:hypothetical protein